MKATQQQKKVPGRYYYMRFEENYFNSYDIRYLESYENGSFYSYILMKLYLLSIKEQGFVCRNGRPYSLCQLAFMLNVSEELLTAALNTLEELELIGRTDDGIIYLPEFNEHIGSVGDEALRKREYRSRIEQKKREAAAAAEKAAPEEAAAEENHIAESPEDTPSPAGDDSSPAAAAAPIGCESHPVGHSLPLGLKESREGPPKAVDFFNPPSFEEVMRFNASNALMPESGAQDFYKYYTGLNWHTVSGEPLTDWKARLKAWSFNKSKQPSQ